MAGFDVAAFVGGRTQVNPRSIFSFVDHMSGACCAVVEDVGLALPAGEVTIALERDFRFSSESLVLFGVLQARGFEARIVAKFHMSKSKPYMLVEPKADALENYKRLRAALAESASLAAEVRVCGAALLRASNGALLRVEERVAGYRKFWKAAPDRLHSIVGTQEPVLFRLQQFLHETSKGEHTIVNM